MTLYEIVAAISNGVARIDASQAPFRAFQPGVGPYGEPQLVKLLAAYLNILPEFHGSVRTKRTPDLLIPGEWAIEFKIA